MVKAVLSVGALVFYIYCILKYNVPFNTIPLWAIVLIFLSLVVLAFQRKILADNNSGKSDKENNG